MDYLDIHINDQLTNWMDSLSFNKKIEEIPQTIKNNDLN